MWALPFRKGRKGRKKWGDSGEKIEKTREKIVAWMGIKLCNELTGDLTGK